MSNFVDITGNRYGKLVVVKLIEKNSTIGHKWLCKCDCNNEKIVGGRELKRKDSRGTKHCGCSAYECKLKDITDQRFGKLVALRLSKERDNSNRTQWVCVCDCDITVEKLIRTNDLLTNKTKSCGCIRDEKVKIRMTGSNHYKWIVNRDEVLLRKRLHSRCRMMLTRVLKNSNQSKVDKTLNMLGYTQEQLMERLGIKELKDLVGYEIDHIFPINAFIFYNIHNPKIINSLDNLQLLTPEENGSGGKWDKYDKEEFENWLKLKNVCFNSKLDNNKVD